MQKLKMRAEMAERRAAALEAEMEEMARANGREVGQLKMKLAEAKVRRRRRLRRHRHGGARGAYTIT